MKINGSDKEYIFIELDYHDGCMAAYPWKYQLILSTEGKLINIFSGQRFEFRKIFKNENPFLVIVIGTSKGNGIHEIYRINSDTLENILDNHFDKGIRTYDENEDDRIFEPFELALKVNDNNNDGFNDISFIGKIVYTENLIINGREQTKAKIPIKLIFLYDTTSRHFVMKENYFKKYKILY